MLFGNHVTNREAFPTSSNSSAIKMQFAHVDLPTSPFLPLHKSVKTVIYELVHRHLAWLMSLLSGRNSRRRWNAIFHCFLTILFHGCNKLALKLMTCQTWRLPDPLFLASDRDRPIYIQLDPHFSFINLLEFVFHGFSFSLLLRPLAISYFFTSSWIH